MNRILSVALAAFLFSTAAHAAKDPCKGVKIQKDAFGSTRVAEVGDLKLKRTADKWVFVLGMNKGGGYGAFSTNNMEFLPEGTAVEILMEDGSSINLLTVGAAGPTMYSIMGVMVTHYDLNLAVSDEHIGLLLSQPVKAYRVLKGADTWQTDEFKSGDIKKFQEIGTCMRET
jgi:hypothetical protein